MAETIQMARRQGLIIPIVYNSNGYDSVKALRKIRGLVDIYLPDIKYLDPTLARKYSQAGDYPKIIPGVLTEMFDQVGHLQMDGNGIATRGVLVRHLVLPSHLTNTRKCLKLLAAFSPEIYLSIMSQYSPQYQTCHYPEINRPLTRGEYDEIVSYALELGLDNAFIQELDSQDNYLPDFDKSDPFNNS